MPNNLEEREKREGKDTEAPRGGNRRTLLLVIAGALLIVILATVGVGIVAVKMGFAEQLLMNMLGDTVERDAEKEPQYMYSVPEILVNISVEGRDRFLSVKFYLGHDDPKLDEELERRMPEIRDAVLKILWRKSIDEVNTPEGKELLREEIFQEVNDLLGGKLRGVYFWHVMVQ